MTLANRGLFLAAIGCLLASLIAPAWGADGAAGKINVLIIDGQNNHKWQETTPVLKEMLLQTGRFNVDVLTSPPAKAPKDAWEKFRPDLSKVNVVLVNYTGSPWSKDIEKDFETFVQNGGGLVFYHAAVFSHPRWETWNLMMGMGWRDAKAGDRLVLDDSGKVVRTPKGEGPRSGHGPAHAFAVVMRDKDHPVMKGLPEKWTHVKDELYHGMRGPAKDMHILATAWSDPKGKGTGAHEPMAWTVPCGTGRVFVTLLGHDVPALKAPVGAALLVRGVEWAATGKVTIPAPKAPAAAAE